MRKGRRVFCVRYRLSDIDAFDTRNGENVAGPADSLVHPFQPFERVELRDFRLLKRSVQLHHSNFIADAERAIEDPRDRQPAEVFAVVEIGDKDLQRTVPIARRVGYVVDDRFEEGTEIGRGIIFK